MDEMYGFDSREGEYVSSKGLESMTMIPLPLPVAAEEYDHHDYHNSNLMMMMINNHHRIHPTMFVSDELLGQSSALSHESASVNLHNQRDDDDDDDDEDEDLGVMKAKIASHPSYPKLLQAYIDCRKVGAPPEIVSVLDEIRLEKEKEKEEEEEEEEEVDLLLLRNQQSQSQSQSHSTAPLSTLNIDPHLHHFMESYCHILVKLKSDLSRPFDEATSFLNQIQAQLLSLSSGSDDFPASSGEELIEIQDAETKREDRQLKEKLLRMYGSHISSLKLEFSKKKKKGKLPEEGRQTLLNWWNLHSKWPYPTEADKIALAETTGLDQKQINNWFINQRKRHWKSPDNMHLDGVGVGVADNLSPNFLHH